MFRVTDPVVTAREGMHACACTYEKAVSPTPTRTPAHEKNDRAALLSGVSALCVDRGRATATLRGATAGGRAVQQPERERGTGAAAARRRHRAASGGSCPETCRMRAHGGKAVLGAAEVAGVAADGGRAAGPCKGELMPQGQWHRARAARRCCSPDGQNERRCARAAASARRTYSEGTGPGSSPGSSVSRRDGAGSKARDWAVLEHRKRAVADARLALRRRQHLASFESRESATVARRLVSTTMGLATYMDLEVDARPVP